MKGSIMHGSTPHHADFAQFHRGMATLTAYFTGKMGKVSPSPPFGPWSSGARHGSSKSCCNPALCRYFAWAKSRKVERSGLLSLAAAGGDRFPLFPEKEPVAVAT